MARQPLTLTKATFLDLEGRASFQDGGGAPPVITVTRTTYETDAAAYVTAAATYVTDTAVATSTLATLVADGASPTQAHVTAHNNAVTQQVTDYTALAAAYTALAAAYTAMKTQIQALSAETGDVYLSYDTAKVSSLNDFNKVLDRLRRLAHSAGLI